MALGQRSVFKSCGEHAFFIIDGDLIFGNGVYIRLPFIK